MTISDLDPQIIRVGLTFFPGEEPSSLFLTGPLDDLIPIDASVVWRDEGVLSRPAADILLFSSFYDDPSRSDVEKELQRWLPVLQLIGFRPQTSDTITRPDKWEMDIIGNDGGTGKLRYVSDHRASDLGLRASGEGLELVPVEFTGWRPRGDLVLLVSPNERDRVKRSLSGLGQMEEILERARIVDFARRMQVGELSDLMETERRLSSDPNYGEPGLVFEWAEHPELQYLQMNASRRDLIEIDRLARMACAGMMNSLRGGGIRQPVSFSASAERCLARCWQVGRFGPEQNDNTDYSGCPAPVEEFLRARANAILHLTSKERRAGRFGLARALLRASGLELWDLGLSMRSETPEEIPPRYLEDCVIGLRVLSSGFRRDFVNLVSGRKGAHFNWMLRDRLIEVGFLDSERWNDFTELGRKLVAEQLAHEQSDAPTLMSIACFVPSTALAPENEPDEDQDEAFVPYDEALSHLKVTTVLARVQEEAPDLLPFRMEIRKGENDLTILFRGEELLLLGLTSSDETRITQIEIRHMMPDLLLMRILAEIDERARARLEPDLAFEPDVSL